MRILLALTSDGVGALAALHVTVRKRCLWQLPKDLISALTVYCVGNYAGQCGATHFMEALDSRRPERTVRPRTQSLSEALSPE